VGGFPHPTTRTQATTAAAARRVSDTAGSLLVADRWQRARPHDDRVALAGGVVQNLCKAVCEANANPDIARTRVQFVAASRHGTESNRHSDRPSRRDGNQQIDTDNESGESLA